MDIKKTGSERERLLKLIDSDEKTGRSVKRDDRVVAPATKLSKTFAIPRSGIKSLPLVVGACVSPAHGMSLVTKSLLILLVLLMGYGMVDLMANLMIVKAPMPVKATGTMRNPSNPAPSLEPVDHYVDTIAQSDVFNSQRINGAPVESSVEEAGISGPLKLVGIDWDNEPVAMIEDVQSGKTYFAKENTFIKDIKVLKIQKEKVTISRGNMVAEIK